MQGITLGALSGIGIVPTLVILGIVLKMTNVAPDIGGMSIALGIIIGVVYAVLGVVGIANRYM
jgi:hypothetical protein